MHCSVGKKQTELLPADQQKIEQDLNTWAGGERCKLLKRKEEEKLPVLFPVSVADGR